MAAAVDILMNENNDLLFADGDFKTGPSDEQHARHLMMFDKGTLRHQPLMCCGLRRYMNQKMSPAKWLALKKEIRLQLSADGYRVNNVVIGSRAFKIDYERV